VQIFSFQQHFLTVFQRHLYSSISTAALFALSEDYRINRIALAFFRKNIL